MKQSVIWWTRRGASPAASNIAVYVDRARNLGVFMETWESVEPLTVHGSILAASPHLQKIAFFIDPDFPPYPVEVYEKGDVYVWPVRSGN